MQIAGQKIKLIDFVHYQNGSVVSKEIISKETGTVTLFKGLKKFKMMLVMIKS